jgi:flagellar biogenesis protein FliO
MYGILLVMFVILLLCSSQYALCTETAAVHDVAGSGMLDNMGFGWLFLRMIIALVIVCLLAYVVIRWGVPKIVGIKTDDSKLIKVVECFQLEPKKRIYIVEVTGKYLLLGVSEQYMIALSDVKLDENIIGEMMEERQKKMVSENRKQRFLDVFIKRDR